MAADGWEEQFAALSSKKHSEQTIFWLNGFWKQGAQEEAETLWDVAHMFGEIELGHKKMYGSRKSEYKEGCDLDEMQSHVLLEKMGETLTVRALRKRLKEIDIDNNNKMCVSEYLLVKYGKTPIDLVNSSQGEVDPEALAQAQAAVEAVSAALAEVTTAHSASVAAAASAAASLKAATEAKEKQDKAEAEVQAAVDELKAQEDAYNAEIAKFEKLGNDPDAGVVKKNRAKNQLAQLQAEDPLPLRKAKITQGSALKRATKASKAATAAAEAAAEEKAKADKAKADLEEEVKKTEAAMVEAEQQLEKIKKKGDGVPQGQIWWMEREITETRKFMPR
mmetsp:Transcript_16148/g.17927  ORF Transcript_16148/g.17927 Transcript_16148/m.17927 type:complete len:335 (+) Transcript_16148:27-1031(+)|eukprot:CAMPEP_0205822290 /NCGR_PEP_ID=MMETSP0206-20130828/11979_1 /ASSEMBLY_ACC=CAM_ASM_000279 /TAXON_ID=36767 /ORGANISM="Euplotes focardii, Strain TN1" /LENGTH=334 /DNA_ID=CAMNT_0053118435 /DNA_START=33 /DNA_END=1037 /DNA_ORIENTATION=+